MPAQHTVHAATAAAAALGSPKRQDRPNASTVPEEVSAAYQDWESSHGKAPPAGSRIETRDAVYVVEQEPSRAHRRQLSGGSQRVSPAGTAISSHVHSDFSAIDRKIASSLSRSGSKRSQSSREKVEYTPIPTPGYPGTSGSYANSPLPNPPSPHSPSSAHFTPSPTTYEAAPTDNLRYVDPSMRSSKQYSPSPAAEPTATYGGYASDVQQIGKERFNETLVQGQHSPGSPSRRGQSAYAQQSRGSPSQQQQQYAPQQQYQTTPQTGYQQGHSAQYQQTPQTQQYQTTPQTGYSAQPASASQYQSQTSSQLPGNLQEVNMPLSAAHSSPAAATPANKNANREAVVVETVDHHHHHYDVPSTSGVPGAATTGVPSSTTSTVPTGANATSTIASPSAASGTAGVASTVPGAAGAASTAAGTTGATVPGTAGAAGTTPGTTTTPTSSKRESWGGKFNSFKKSDIEEPKEKKSLKGFFSGLTGKKSKDKLDESKRLSKSSPLASERASPLHSNDVGNVLSGDVHPNDVNGVNAGVGAGVPGATGATGVPGASTTAGGLPSATGGLPSASGATSGTSGLGSSGIGAGAGAAGLGAAGTAALGNTQAGSALNKAKGVESQAQGLQSQAKTLQSDVQNAPSSLEGAAKSRVQGAESDLSNQAASHLPGGGIPGVGTGSGSVPGGSTLPNLGGSSGTAAGVGAAGVGAAGLGDAASHSHHHHHHHGHHHSGTGAGTGAGAAGAGVIGAGTAGAGVGGVGSPGATGASYSPTAGVGSTGAHSAQYSPQSGVAGSHSGSAGSAGSPTGTRSAQSYGNDHVTGSGYSKPAEQKHLGTISPSGSFGPSASIAGVAGGVNKEHSAPVSSFDPGSTLPGSAFDGGSPGRAVTGHSPQSTTSAGTHSHGLSSTAGAAGSHLPQSHGTHNLHSKVEGFEKTAENKVEALEHGIGSDFRKAEHGIGSDFRKGEHGIGSEFRKGEQDLKSDFGHHHHGHHHGLEAGAAGLGAGGLAAGGLSGGSNGLKNEFESGPRDLKSDFTSRSDGLKNQFSGDALKSDLKSEIPGQGLKSDFESKEAGLKNEFGNAKNEFSGNALKSDFTNREAGLKSDFGNVKNEFSPSHLESQAKHKAEQHAVENALGGKSGALGGLGAGALGAGALGSDFSKDGLKNQAEGRLDGYKSDALGQVDGFKSNAEKNTVGRVDGFKSDVDGRVGGLKSEVDGFKSGEGLRGEALGGLGAGVGGGAGVGALGAGAGGASSYGAGSGVGGVGGTSGYPAGAGVGGVGSSATGSSASPNLGGFRDESVPTGPTPGHAHVMDGRPEEFDHSTFSGKTKAGLASVVGALSLGHKSHNKSPSQSHGFDSVRQERELAESGGHKHFAGVGVLGDRPVSSGSPAGVQPSYSPSGVSATSGSGVGNASGLPGSTPITHDPASGIPLSGQTGANGLPVPSSPKATTTTTHSPPSPSMAKNMSVRSGQAGVGIVPGSRPPTEGELERAKYGPYATAVHQQEEQQSGSRGVHIDATGYEKAPTGVSGVSGVSSSGPASGSSYGSAPTSGVSTNIGESPATVKSGTSGIPSGGATQAADTAVDIVSSEIPQTEEAGQHLNQLGSPENPAVNVTGTQHTKLRADGFATEETPRYAAQNSQFDGFTGSTPLANDTHAGASNLNSSYNPTAAMDTRHISTPYESTGEGPGVAGQTPVHREIHTTEFQPAQTPFVGSGSTTAAVKGVPPTQGVIPGSHGEATSLGSSVDAQHVTAVSQPDASGLRKRVDHVEVTKTTVIKETPPPPPLPHLAPQDQIQYFGADYVIVVKPLGAQKDLQHIEQLTGLLAANHIDTKVRDGQSNELLVFLKFSEHIIDRAASHSHVNDFLYHLRSDNPKNLAKNSFEQLREHSKEYKSSERLRLVHHYLSAPEIDGGLGIDPSNPKFSYIDAIFPLQDRKKNQHYATLLGSKWVVDDEDLDAINDLYGEQVAFYFGFSQFYLQWLLVPSVIGVLAHFLLPNYSFFYTLVVQIWSIVFVRAWRSRETNLAIRFGATNASAVGERRAFVSETTKHDMISDLKRPWYSPTKRVAKELAFIPVASTLAAILVVGHTIIFALEIYTRQIYHGPFGDLAPLVPTGLLVVFLGVFKVIYGVIAKKMTDWENHEFEGVYTRSLTIKLFVVDFLSSYFGLFLTGFIYLPFGQNLVGYLNIFQQLVNFLVGDTVIKPFTVDGSRLYGQMIYFLGTAQVINFILSRALPILLRFALPVVNKLRGVVVQAPVELAPQEEHYMDIVRGERSKTPYNVTSDYRSTITQFGFVALFGPVWALGPLCALVHNFLSLRSEFLKISVDFQRPTPRRVENIQPWDDILTFITWLGSLSTTALVVMLRSIHYENDAAVAFTSVKYVSVSQTLGIDGTSLGVVTVAPWFVLAAVLYAEHQYLFVSRLTDFVLGQFDSPEVVTDKRSRYQLRKALLAAEGSDSVQDIVFGLSGRGGVPPKVDIQTVDVILKRRQHPNVPNHKKVQ